ncbi:MAG TPA: DUF1801 domain-containing protein [Leptospiraceae bacterium]|nr:DUF1801 domain-containing protein [Leptospiraceae bacterium]HMZ58693.1 DUF1801 domain-containing protein [Leptospiraceae bacterium]HNF13927.1 DUF1801 domain-containing protein [Leptospiraceae bacterium]HNF25996.1 DUF1801 domain-containing protein [Leptospiraceae bacterium]HNH07512.1 DUF1801 domain-containing protein [Leptospiraceae bacterium]
MKKETAKKYSDDVLKFISRLESPWDQLFLEMRNLIVETLPEFEESLKYGTPFYTHKGLLCYLSLKGKKEKYLDFGLCQGFKIQGFEDVLLFQGRNTVKSVRIDSKKDIQKELFQKILQEAWMVNEFKE